MKTIQLVRNMAIATIALAITACSDDLAGEKQPTTAQPGTITVTKADVNETRVLVTDEMTGDGEQLNVKWQMGDEIFIGSVPKIRPELSYEQSESFNTVSIDNEGKAATFDVGETSFSDDNIYKIFTGTFNEISNYTQTGNNNTDHLSELPMVGNYIAEDDNIIRAVAMKHAMSVFKVVFVLPQGAEIPDKLEVSAGSSTPFVKRALPSSFFFEGEERTYQALASSISLNLVLDEMPADRTLTIYMPIMVAKPVEGSLTVTLQKQGTSLYWFTQTYSSGKTRTFEPGKIYTNTLVFDDPYNSRIAETFDNNVVAATGYAEGNGEEATPYLISNTRELKYLINSVPGASEGKFYKLTTDIHVTADEWTPATFKGTFDGNGHTISGALKRVSTGGADFGFFDEVTNGTVKNLNVTASVNSYSSAVGSVVGTATNATIENCTSSGAITGTRYIGGIVGFGRNTTISNCTNRGAITGTDTYGYVGGIAGKADVMDDGITSISQCNNYGAIKGVKNIGGLIGEFGAFNKAANNTIHQSHNYATSIIATETAGDKNAGKLVGGNYGTIYNCCTSVAVTGVNVMYGTNAAGSEGSTLTACTSGH